MARLVTGPLAGVRVLDLTAMVMGPYCTQIMADMGADVIKIEPPGGDVTRYVTVGPAPGMSGVFVNVNRGKRSIVLDLRSETGKAALRALIETADVFIHSMRAKAIAKLGFGYDDVAAINPAIVYTNCYGYSRRGPDRDLPAYDDTIQAECGLPAVQQMLTGEASYVGTIMADKVAGLTALYATMMALFHRERTGEGQEVEVSMFETMASFMLVEHANGAILSRPSDRPAIPGRWLPTVALSDQRRLHFGADLHRQALVGVHRRRSAAMGQRSLCHARAAGPPDRHGIWSGGPDDARAHHRGMADVVPHAGNPCGTHPHTRRAVRQPAPERCRAVRDGR